MIRSNRCVKAIIVVLTLLLLMSCSIASTLGEKEALNPMAFGLSDASTGIERYNVLLKTHQAAIIQGRGVSYSGIKEISIEIPPDAKGIPLCRHNDFAGVVLNIKNTEKNLRLFYTNAKRKEIELSGKVIDDGNYSNIQELKNGCYLLVIEDLNPWGGNRDGYEYAHKRKDVIIINNGRAKNAPIMPYGNSESSPKCSYRSIGNSQLIIRNLTVNRTKDCTFKTDIFYADSYSNVLFDNVVINTPPSNIENDYAIRIHNCANLTFKNITINGTYSKSNRGGYGISLNNIYNLYCNNIYGRGEWGIFGNNNINKATLENCDINRFDIHCYGRDCFFMNTKFVDLGNHFSSVYGIIRFDDCTFTNFTPLINRSSYNAFVGYDLYFKNCVFNVTKDKKYFLNLGRFSEEINPRKELALESWPNIYVEGLTVNMMDGAKDFILITNRKAEGRIIPIDYIQEIIIKGLTINMNDTEVLRKFYLCATENVFKKQVNCEIKGLEIVNKLNNSTTKDSGQTLILNIPVSKGSSFKRINGVKIRQL